MFADVPPSVVTLTETTPGFPAPGGVVAVICVESVTVIPVACTPLNVTVVAPTMKSVPVIVTEVAPSRGPLAGETPVTVGIGT